MLYGYVRISTPGQNIDRQIRNIHRRYPVALIVQEIYTGRTLDRPKWRKLLKQLKPGDIIIFDSVSRMARDAEEGFEEYQKLYASGIELIFLQEPHINTEVYRRALQVCIPKTGTKVDVILEAVETYLMLLAKEQIKIADGQRLELQQKDIKITGHAIECRINAENPEKNFRPSPGKITDVHFPGGEGVRVDSAIYTGYEVPPYYDSMLAKLIVHADDREEAIRKMRSALGEVIIEGVDTNIDYQYEILNHKKFISGDIDVEFIGGMMNETA